MDEYPYPRFSLEERDRRWRAVKERMRAEELVAIVVPANTGHQTDLQANARYLSHCGGGADADITVVFPMQGEVTVGATSAIHRWPPVQTWTTDIREARRDYGKVIIGRLRELDVTAARVGITGLGRGTRTPEGTILFQTMRRLSREFPTTSFVDATGILEEVRLVKSDEEVAFLQQSNDLIDEAFQTVLATARPGVSDHLVWAEATSTILRGGSEPTIHTNWVSGRAPARTLSRASFRKLKSGDIIINELEASWAGYRSQGVQPICVGSCDYEYQELIRLQKDIFDDVLPRLSPGVTVGELADTTEKCCATHRPTAGPASDATARLIMHGRGQGDDGPIVTPDARDPYQLRKELREGMAVVLKPSVSCSDGSHPINWGDTVVVTPSGGRRLGKRAHGIWVAA